MWDEMILHPLGQPTFLKALLASLLIGFANGFLSGFVILRKSSLMLGPLSHGVLPGIVVAVGLFGLSAWPSYLGALIVAILVGLASNFVARTSRVDSQSAMAVVYTTSFAIGLLLVRYFINQEKLGATDLESWLFGGMLTLTDQDLWTTFWTSLFIIITLCIFRRPLLLTLFEPSVAKSQGISVRWMQSLLVVLIVLGLITSLQAVGAILSVAMLVAPGAIVLLYTNSTSRLFWGGAIVGAFVAMLSVFVSYWFNLGSGNTMVLLFGIVFFLSFMFSPKYGYVARLFSKPHKH